MTDEAELLQVADDMIKCAYALLPDDSTPTSESERDFMKESVETAIWALNRKSGARRSAHIPHFADMLGYLFAHLHVEYDDVCKKKAETELFKTLTKPPADDCPICLCECEGEVWECSTCHCVVCRGCMERWLGSNVAFHIPQNEAGEQYMHESLDSHRTCPRCRAIVNEHFVNNVEHVVNNEPIDRSQRPGEDDGGFDDSGFEAWAIAEAEYFAEHGVHTWGPTEHPPLPDYVEPELNLDDVV
jgi:hypothetical protein